MKAFISIAMLLVGSSAFAEEVRINPEHIDNGVYTQSPNIDEHASFELVPVQMLSGNMTACSPSTPAGTYCFCNRWMFRGAGIHAENHPGGFYMDEKQHAVRRGFHILYHKGTHTRSCSRD